MHEQHQGAQPVFLHKNIPGFIHLGLVILVVLLGIIWYSHYESKILDDAFISYRYAAHIADGSGIVWNPGGEPTQGYTSFLHVLLVSLSLKVGISPVLASFLLNILGLAVTVSILFRLTSQLLHPHDNPGFFLLALPALAVIAMPITLENTANGLETVFWTGLIYASAVQITHYAKEQQTRQLVIIYVLCFLLCLTRPDSVLFISIWLLGLLISTGWKAKRQIIIGGLLFGLAGLVYVLWLAFYFGDPIPNPFYVKALSSEAHLPGSIYIRGFLRDFTFGQPIAVYFAIVGFVLLIKNHTRIAEWVWPFTALLSLPVFYLFTDPAMGGAFRFLYPTAVLITYAIVMGITAFVTIVRKHITNSEAANKRWYEAAGWGLAIAAFIGISLAYFVPGIASTTHLLTQPTVTHNARLLQTACALAEVPDIRNTTIAYTDAGMIAYYTEAQFLDIVGLNDNQIARQGSQHGPEWVIDYVLEQTPDLISIYTYEDGRIYKGGHGIIGTSLDRLYLTGEFSSNYEYVGGLDYGWEVFTHWFVRHDSPNRQPLVNAIQAIADFTQFEFIAE